MQPCRREGDDRRAEAVVQDCLGKDQGGADDWFEAAQLDNYGFSATAKDVDTIEASRPVALWGNDGHTVWVNSRGLALLGVTAETPDISGGKIARDAKGAPTGYFADRASIFVDEKIPSPALEEKVALTAAELKKMSASGITALMDAFVTPAEAAVWRTLYDTGRLPMRVRTAIYVADPSDDSDEAVSRLVKASKDGDVDPDFLRSGLVKVFADGVMEYPAQTAAMLSPYLDADGKPTKHEGELYFDPQRFAGLVQKLDAAGLTVHIHAIGDRAVRASLDAFAAARAANGREGQINAAYAMRQDKTTGSLEVGKRADLVVLDRDIFSVDPDTLPIQRCLRPIWMDGLSIPLQGTTRQNPIRINPRQLARFVVRLPASSAWSLLCVADCASAPQAELRGTEGRWYQASRPKFTAILNFNRN